MARTFELPDNTVPSQSTLFQMLAGIGRFGVVSGCAITWGSDLTLDIAEGVVRIDGEDEDYGGATVNIAAQKHASNPRWVLVAVDEDGATVAAGTAEVDSPPDTYPKLPDIPDGKIVNAAIKLQTDDVSLAVVASGNRALDWRIFVAEQAEAAEAPETTDGVTEARVNELIDSHEDEDNAHHTPPDAEELISAHEAEANAHHTPPDATDGTGPDGVVTGMSFDEDTRTLTLTRSEDLADLTQEIAGGGDDVTGLVIPGLGVPANNPPDRTYDADATLPALVYAHDITINAGVTLQCPEDSGVLIICTGTFTNRGTLTASGRGPYRAITSASITPRDGFVDGVLPPAFSANGSIGSYGSVAGGSGIAGGAGGTIDNSPSSDGQDAADGSLAVVRAIATALLEHGALVDIGGGQSAGVTIAGTLYTGVAGGSSIIVIASTFDNAGGTIESEGVDGAAHGGGGGGVGGGGGGVAAALYETLTGAGTFSAAGGTGGGTAGDGGDGIAGAFSIYG